MSGFVPKSGRPTKGGSLSRTARAQGFLHYFFRHEPSVGSSGEQAANGAMNRGLNETQLHVGGKSEPRRNVGSSRNGAASLNHAYPESLYALQVSDHVRKRRDSEARGILCRFNAVGMPDDQARCRG